MSTGGGIIETIENYSSLAPADMVFDSTYGDIYLYNFRVTRQEIIPQEIIKRYIADFESISTRVNLWQGNNLFGDIIN
jgi:hypothetical protein